MLARGRARPGIRRVRFTTSHPRDFTPQIVDGHRGERRCSAITCICRCSRARPACWQRMQREYTRDDYMRRIDRLKPARRPIALSTDIIVGFPGETEEDFEQTLSLLEEVGYDSVFSFKYSPRAEHARRGLRRRHSRTRKSRGGWRYYKRCSAASRSAATRPSSAARRKCSSRAGAKSSSNGSAEQRRTACLNFSDPRRLGGGEDLHGAYCRVRVAGIGAEFPGG